MGDLKKKNLKASATQYLTKSQAIRRLQLSSADFTRLAILKGIYPVVVPSIAASYNGARTYYLRKDIAHLSHEPLLEKLRQFKVYRRRLARLLAKQSWAAAKSLQLHSRPSYSLDHLIRERYPTFEHALADLDDALSTVCLFAWLPVDLGRASAGSGSNGSGGKSTLADCVAGFSEARLKDCRRLSLEFMRIMADQHAIRRCFISIKGFYFQASLLGGRQAVTWLMPHQVGHASMAASSSNSSSSNSGKDGSVSEVDLRIMYTFLEFYVCLLGFVNYRLYRQAGYVYPPRMDDNVDSLVGVFLEKQSVDDGQSSSSAESSSSSSSTAPSSPESSPAAPVALLLQDKRVLINREVPLVPTELLVMSSGGIALNNMTSSSSNSNNSNSSASASAVVDYHLLDRPLSDRAVVGRCYVQPQWLFDSVNANQLLPADAYKPGAILPAHLSPFEPSQQLSMLADEEEEEAEEDEDEDDDEEKEEHVAEEETRQIKQQSSSSAKEQKKPKASASRKALLASMLTGKQRKLYQKIQHKQQQQQQRNKAV